MTQLINIASYTLQGNRPYQEDSLSVGDHFVLVADGVGGFAKGDVASNLVAQHIIEALQNMEQELELSSEFVIQGAINLAQRKLNDYALENSESQNMGSTLALIVQLRGWWYSVHVGDSRCYHIGKDGQIKWKSKDHSLVQQLVDEGIISQEEAQNHPRKNVITRVIQSGNQNNTEADIHVLAPIQDGDRFFVCTDGVLESWDEEMLIAIIHQSKNTEEAINEIKMACELNSNDNNSAVLATVVVSEHDESNATLLADFGILADPVEDFLGSSQSDKIVSINEIPNKPNPNLLTESFSKDAYLRQTGKKKKKALSRKSVFLIGVLAALLMILILTYLRPLYKDIISKDLSESEDYDHSPEKRKFNSRPKYKETIASKVTDPKKSKNNVVIEEDTLGSERIEKNTSSETFVILNSDQPDITREETLYNQIKKKGNKTLCLAYLKEFPKGKYVNEVKTICDKVVND